MAKALIASLSAMPFAPISEGGGVGCGLHCAAALSGCMLSSACRARFACLPKCFTPGTDAGSCLATCIISHPSKEGDAVTRCLNEHECLPLPISMNDTCKRVVGAQPFNMSLLETNKWWVIYGHNPQADCHDCQRRHIHPVADADGAPQWLYDYTVLVQAANHSRFNYTLHTPLMPTHEQLTRMTSWRWPWGADAGLPYIEEWHLLDAAPTHLQIYYCVTFNQSVPHPRPSSMQLEGGLVLARGKSIPTAVLPRIRKLYNAMGVDFDSYCRVDNTCASASLATAS